MAVSHLITLFRQCLLRRVLASDFLDEIKTQKNLSGKVVFKALLDCRESFCTSADPLPALYLECLAVSNVMQVSDVLVILIAKWNHSAHDRKLCQLPEAGITSLHELTMLLMSSKLILDLKETRACLLLTAELVTVISRSIARDSTQTATATGSRTLEALGSILATICVTNAGVQTLSEKSDIEKSEATKARSQSHTTSSVRQAVDLAISIFPAISVQLMDRLGAIQKHISIFVNTQDQENSAQQSDMQALQFQASINEVQMSASRAGTFTYFEALLNKAVTIDDTTVLNFMAGRHNNDYQSMFLDVLFNSFELLNLDLSSPKADLYLQQYHVFILNKLPIILSGILASSFGSFSAEETLTTAWNQIQVGLTADHLTNIGHRFMYLCSLHQLSSTDNALSLIGGQVPNQTAKSLYSKDELVTQFSSSHSRVIRVVGELTQLDGNATSISQATVEIMHAYCQAKETHHLKDLVNTITKSPAIINILAMSIRPAYWLGPLCTLLDEWHWQEIHGESQPVYDEFGSIFLFILVSQRRLALSKSELGIRNPEGFIARYLDQEGSEKAVSELSEESQQHLGDWINALYIAEGLSDDLTTTCSPHEFYLLVPTLLRQSLLAHQCGKLGVDALKAGLEYLLEPFLLPSLVSGITWIARSYHEETSICASMLQVFTDAPGNTEAKEIHQTILSMMSTTISNSKIPPEQIAMHSNLLKDGTFAFDLRMQPTLMQASLESTITERISTAPIRGDLPAILRFALGNEGLEMTLNGLISAFLRASGSNNFLLALDVVATVICVADKPLRNALQLKYSRLGQLLKRNNTLMAEAIVHLNRCVEAYASVLFVPDMGMDQFATLQLSNIDTTNAEMNNSSNNLQTEEMVDQDQMDDIDQVLDEAAAMGNIEQSDAGMSLDDLYGLQNDNMGLGNLDDLDLDMF